MPSETGRVQLDAWAVFRKVALVTFLVLELAAWQRLARRGRFLRPGQRLLYFLLHPEFTPRSLLLAPIVAGLATLAAFLLARFILRPALEHWLRPRTDPSVGSFHLGPGERVLAGTPARKQVGRSWQAGSLMLTDRRLWFFPEAWSMEPWSAERGEIRNVSAEPAKPAGWLPIRNWPDRVVAETRSGRREVLAVADPAAVLAWFPASAPASPSPLSTLH